MTTSFTKSVSGDFVMGTGCFPELLEQELIAAIPGKTAIVTKPASDQVVINWDIGLSPSEIAIQDGVVAAHNTRIPWQVKTLTGISLSSTGVVRSDNTGQLSSDAQLNDLTGVVLTSPSNGQVLSFNGANWVNAAAPSSSNSSIFAAYNAAGGQSLGGSWVDLIWDNQDRIDADYSHTLGSALITINTAGWYEISFDVSTQCPSGSNTRSTSEVRMLRNGSQLPGTKALMYNRQSGSGDNSCSVTIIKQLTATDVLIVQALRRSGSAIIETYPEGCRITIRAV